MTVGLIVAAVALAGDGGPAPLQTSATGLSTRPLKFVAATPLQRVEAIADTSGFDWRAAGVTIRVGYHPVVCCHWGVYDYRDKSIWIGPKVLNSPTRLRYVVLHEIGHAWQWATRRLGQLAADMAPWGRRGNAALEYSADCLARIWGAETVHYWQCPPRARAMVSLRLSGDWSGRWTGRSPGVGTRPPRAGGRPARP